MTLIGLKERHFLGRERSCRFWLLSLCRLFMKLKLSLTVYCVLLSTSPLYMASVDTKMPAELYHRLLRSQENPLCDMLPIPSYRAGTLTNTPHHTFTSCFPIVRNNPPRVITIPFHCCTTCSRNIVHVSSSNFNHPFTEVSQSGETKWLRCFNNQS